MSAEYYDFCPATLRIGWLLLCKNWHAALIAGTQLKASRRNVWCSRHRGDGKWFVVHADEKLTAFVELEAAISACGELV